MAFYTTPHAHYLELCRALRDGIDVRLQTLDPGSVEARLLQEKRNQLAPISRLPPELFSKIARYIIIEHHGRKRNEDDTFQAVYQQHLVLASVSRSWRQIILEDRILWTDIRTSYLTLAPLLLERSGKAHLTLLLSELHERPKDVIDYGLDLISSHGYRIRELSLRLSSLSNHAVPFLRKPAPAMECFRLSIMEKIDFSYSLFDGSAPCLTKLSLIGVMFPWDMPLLYSLPLLRYLTISRDPDSETPSWDQLTKILRSMPSLKYLKIHYALPSSVELFPTATHSLIVFPSQTGPHSISHAEVVMDTPEIAAVAFTTRECDFNPKPEVVWDFYLSWYPEQDESSEIFIGWMVTHLLLSECKHFNHNALLTQEAWGSYINCMPEMVDLEIELEEEDVIVFVNSLLIPDPNLVDPAVTLATHQPIPLPKLESLTINSDLALPDWNAIYEMLKNRQDRGYGLKSILVILPKSQSEAQDEVEETVWNDLVALGIERIQVLAETHD
ncbi:hypothetical protein AX16_007111 [Volvariella volvacea WC 439]|nr:hypothetical protein AX16_007111 [Volvariella volvacea WC 439]